MDQEDPYRLPADWLETFVKWMDRHHPDVPGEARCSLGYWRTLDPLDVFSPQTGFSLDQLKDFVRFQVTENARLHEEIARLRAELNNCPRHDGIERS